MLENQQVKSTQTKLNYKELNIIKHALQKHRKRREVSPKEHNEELELLIKIKREIDKVR